MKNAFPAPDAQAARRMTLGLTEDDLARQVLVTAETIASFEKGDLVGDDVAEAIDDTLTRLEQGRIDL